MAPGHLSPTYPQSCPLPGGDRAQLVPNEGEEGMKQLPPKHQLCVCPPLVHQESLSLSHPIASHPSSSFSSKARKPIAAAKYQELLFLSSPRPEHALFFVFKLQAFFFVGGGEGGEKAEAWGKNERNVSLGAEFSIAYFKPD